MAQSGRGDQSASSAGDADNEWSHYPTSAWDSWADSPETYPEGSAGSEPTEAYDVAEFGWDTPLPAQQGDVVSGRYRLEEELTHRGGTHSWRAFDQKLSRPVMLHLLGTDLTRCHEVLEAARMAAVATDSRFLRVLDAVRIDPTSQEAQDLPGVGGYIVCEFVPGISLEHMLASGPLSGLEAAWVVRELADALAPMHALGLYHRQINPDTVIVTATGNVKIVGFLTEEAMFPSANGGTEGEAADVQALGQLLYAALVTRWPAPHDESGRDHWGLASAPLDGHGWLTPRQLRAGVSPALDVVCDQVLNPVPRTGGPSLTSAAELNSTLSQVLGTANASADLEHRVRYPASRDPDDQHLPSPRTPVPAPVARPGRDDDGGPHDDGDEDVEESEVAAFDQGRHPPRRWLAILVGLVAITLVGSLIAVGISNGGWAKGGKDPARSTASASATGPQPRTIKAVSDFDPEADGGNGEELPDQVKNAWDGKPGTAWTTMRYRGSPKLGLLKPGVGLVVDLGEPVSVQQVNLTLKGSPTAVQVLVPRDATLTAAPKRTIKEWNRVSSNDAAGEKATLKLRAPTTTRFVLVYLTSLPKVDTGYQGGIAEIQVVGP